MAETTDRIKETISNIAVSVSGSSSPEIATCTQEIVEPLGYKAKEKNDVLYRSILTGAQ